MSRRLLLQIAGILLVGTTSAAQAGQTSWSLGVRVGSPGPAYGPGWGHGGYCGPRPYYYRPYPVYVAPAPVYVAPAPVYVAPPPVYVTQPPVVVQSQPQVYQAPPPPPPPAESNYHAPTAPTTSMARTVSQDANDLEAARTIQQLADPDDATRADAVLRLGRMKAYRAIDPLAATLAGDRSSQVREAAARSLGLIGSPRGLPALQRSASADPDPTVRSTCQFAIEIIQASR